MQAEQDTVATHPEQQEAFDFGPPRPPVRHPHPGERKRVLESLDAARSRLLFQGVSDRAAGWVLAE